MGFREIIKLMDVLGLMDEGVETLHEAKWRIRKEVQLAEKTFNWSSGEVRCLSVKFHSRNEFDRGSLSFKKERYFVIAMKPCN